MEFRNFVLFTEAESKLDQKISDVLSALQDLNKNIEKMGKRNTLSSAETVVSRIRRVIHTHWPQSEERKLKVLQAAAVAIKKAIEEKDDLEEILKTCESNIAVISGGKKVNNLSPEEESPEEEEEIPEDGPEEGKEEGSEEDDQEPGREGPL
jgi:uncharacterized membrane protein YgaE (UPF0421/DUF939 family)